MLSDEENKAIKEVKHFKELTRYWQEEEYEEKEIAGYITTVLNLIEKQSKEIEELKDMNERQKYRIELVSEDKIEERGDSIDESTMLKQIKNKLDEKNTPIETLLAEFERLEDLEDRKLQIEYNNVFNKGVKSVEDKIKAKIEELNDGIKRDMINHDKLKDESWKLAIHRSMAQKIEIKKVLQSLLEKE